MDFKKLFQFSITMFVLSILDILTTIYALEKYPGLREGNGFMSSIISMGYISFVAFKMFAVCVIVGMYKHIQQQNKNIAKVGQCIIIMLMLIVVSNNAIQIASAVDNFDYAPTCLETAFDDDALLQETSNNASNGTQYATNITAGYFSPSNSRIYNSSNILCIKPDPSTLGTLSTQHRLVGTSEDGSVWYTDYSLTDYGAGFYTVGAPTNLYKIGTLASTTKNRKIAIDTQGNIYTNDGIYIYKYVKDSAYAQSLFYTMVDGVDYTVASCVTGCSSSGVDVLGIVADASDNIHMLIGTWGEKAGYLVNGYLSRTVVSQNGVRVKTDLQLENENSQHPSGFDGGGLILDITNPLSNYTYTYQGTATNGLKHNSSTGKTTIAVLTGITDVTGLGYSNYVLYVTSSAQNLIRSFTTSFQGYIPNATGSNPPILLYNTAYVKSVYDEYYNNSDFTIEYRLNFSVPYTAFAFDTLLGIPIGNPYLRYQYRTDLMAVNPNTGLFSSVLSSYPISDRNGVVVCQVPGIDFLIDPNREYNCHAAGTYQIHPSSGIWANGTYRVQLQEITISNSYLAGLSFDNFLVLNYSGTGNVIVIPPGTYPWLDGGDTWKPPNTEIGSTCTVWDDYTSILGMGINNPSRFAFATLIIVFAIAIGLFLSNGNFSVGVCIGFLPYAYFTYLSILTPCGEYMPTWVLVFVACIIAIKMKWF